MLGAFIDFELHLMWQIISREPDHVMVKVLLGLREVDQLSDDQEFEIMWRTPATSEEFSWHQAHRG